MYVPGVPRFCTCGTVPFSFVAIDCGLDSVIPDVVKFCSSFLVGFDKLEFEETKRDGRVWKGINWYVENWNDKVLAEVIKQDGWDTKYM